MGYNEKMNNWGGFFCIGLVVGIIDFIIMVNQEDASNGAKISAIILLIDIVFCIISVVMVNINNAKSKNMSADEYLNDRFTNAIPETKEILGLNKDQNPQGVKCPYCNSLKCRKITTTSRMVSTAVVGVASSKLGKQWHCNNCGSDF